MLISYIILATTINWFRLASFFLSNKLNQWSTSGKVSEIDWSWRKQSDNYLNWPYVLEGKWLFYVVLFLTSSSIYNFRCKDDGDRCYRGSPLFHWWQLITIIAYLPAAKTPINLFLRVQAATARVSSQEKTREDHFSLPLRSSIAYYYLHVSLSSAMWITRNSRFYFTYTNPLKGHQHIFSSSAIQPWTSLLCIY